MLGQIARGMKDSALQLALKSYCNERIGDAGEVLECRVDTGRQRLVLSAMLSGEQEPVVLNVERYRIERDGEQRYVTIDACSSSRPWLDALLRRYLLGRRFRLPATVASLL